jgi:hypothetical protein
MMCIMPISYRIYQNVLAEIHHCVSPSYNEWNVPHVCSNSGGAILPTTGATDSNFPHGHKRPWHDTQVQDGCNWSMAVRPSGPEIIGKQLNYHWTMSELWMSEDLTRSLSGHSVGLPMAALLL